MKCISLWQPWASLWCSDRKVHETRHWPTNHRGWLAVHAAKKKTAASLEKAFADTGDVDLAKFLELVRDEYGGHWAQDLPLGAIVGVVNIVDCVRTETIARVAGREPRDDELCGNFGPQRYAWRRQEYKLLKRPIPYTGRQGMFFVPDEVFVGILQVKK